MGCGATVAGRYRDKVEDESDEEGTKRRNVTPPAENLSRDFSSMLTLSFRGEGLKDGERSFLVVYTRASGETLWTELGKTEVCSLDTTWPVWGTVMELEFRVEVVRHMRCEAYKMSANASLDDLWQHKFIGGCEFMLTEAVTSRAKVHTSSDGWLRKKLVNIRRKRGEKHPGRVCVFADEKHSSKLELYFRVAASQLQTGEFWRRKPDPFFVVNRAQVIGTDDYDLEELGLVPCYRSEVARRTQDPRFGNAVITAAQVSHGVAEQDFIVTLEDWNRLGEPKVLGEVVLNFGELWKAAGEKNLKLPVCKREGPRLKNLLRYSYAQIKKHRQTLTMRTSRSLSGTFSKLGRMGSGLGSSMRKSLSRSFSQSISAGKDLRSSSHVSAFRSEETGSPFPSEQPKEESSGRGLKVPSSKDSSNRGRKSQATSKVRDLIGRSSSHGSTLSPKEHKRSESQDSSNRGRKFQATSKDHVFSSEFSSATSEGSDHVRRGTQRSQRSMASQASKTSVHSGQKRTKKSMSRATTTGLGGGLTPAEKTLFFGPVVGQLVVQDMILDRSYTFLDYVRGGLELRTMMGIDFTRSNMDIMNPDSLHSVSEKGLATAYEDAICNLGQVLRSYDTSNEYFVYGFGAKIPPSHTVCSNCFALTGDFLYPKVKGLEGILQAYRRALNVVQLHGPSCCAEVLNLAGRFSRKFVQEPEKEMLRSSVPPDMLYFVLLILTDGELESEKKVVEELRELQAYPISVVFIGIGSKDFGFMRELPEAMAVHFEKDFEKPKLENLSKKVTRRVVQFVQYSEYESNPDGLIAATLADLPREIVLYYRMLGVKPRGLERFENKFGEPLPTPLPKAAKLEWKAAEQRTADRKARETVLATKTSRRDHDASKETSGSGPRSLTRTVSRQSQINSVEGGESLIQSSHLSLQAQEEDATETLPEEAELLSSSSDDEGAKPSKREEENLPVFLQEEKKRLITEAMAIGYKKHQITRALRDGIPSASVEVLLDNIRYSGYGKLPSYKDAAVASLPDDAPLPWNPFKTQAENEKKIKQLDDELEDYGAQLLALASPAKNDVSRHDVLSTSGVFACKRSRITQPRAAGPPSAPSPLSSPTLAISPTGSKAGPVLRRSNSALSNSRTRNLEDWEDPGNGGGVLSPSGTRNWEEEDPGSPSQPRNGPASPKSGGDTQKQVEEAARRLRSLQAKSSKLREAGDYPPIKEEDERAEVVDVVDDRSLVRPLVRPPTGQPATLSAPSMMKFDSSRASSKALSKDGLLE